jgi:hypothetical protein
MMSTFDQWDQRQFHKQELRKQARLTINAWNTPIAALYVITDGHYYNQPGIDPWDKNRDARLYDGPHPVVAHPPCARWCQLASVNHKRWGTPIAEDGGLFERALEQVREHGGVLEHPAYSLAYPKFGMPRPVRGEWSEPDEHGGVSIQVSQCAYGHPARKRTWLYGVGIDTSIPLRHDEPPTTGGVGSGIKTGNNQKKRITAVEAMATPPEFRELLIALARSVYESKEEKGR